jgi:hypothetical protein
LPERELLIKMDHRTCGELSLVGGGALGALACMGLVIHFNFAAMNLFHGFMILRTK